MIRCMKSRRYTCSNCGEVFSYSALGSLMAVLTKGPVCIDPAPSILNIFDKPRCPKCNSQNLEKIK